MCLVLWANDCHRKYILVVAANRDEFYRRPTLPADFWQDNPTILAGKDLQEGGTWMGITTTGRFATLTNYRDPSNHNHEAPSRGHLIQKYLEDHAGPEYYMKNLLNDTTRYNGFNLLAGTYENLYYFSNREKIIRQVEKGVHGLSNSLLDVPWPKVATGVNALNASLQEDEINVEHLFEIMADSQKADDDDLPQTGVSLELERMLSPLFVESPDYGTRTTTVLLIDRNLQVEFWERSFIPQQAGTWNEVYYDFKIK